MIQANFKCKDCKRESYFPFYRIIQKGGVNTYVNKASKPLMCPKCKSINLGAINGNTDFASIQIGKFSGKTSEEKKMIINKRARKHFQEKERERVEYESKNFKIKGAIQDGGSN